MAENTNISNQLANLITSDNIQRYILGHKKSGEARALYDIVKDIIKFRNGGKKKKKKKARLDSFSLELIGKKKKKKKKKKKDKDLF